jgi:hypothetical protein
MIQRRGNVVLHRRMQISEPGLEAWVDGHWLAAAPGTNVGAGCKQVLKLQELVQPCGFPSENPVDNHVHSQLGISRCNASSVQSRKGGQRRLLVTSHVQVKLPNIHDMMIFQGFFRRPPLSMPGKCDIWVLAPIHFGKGKVDMQVKNESSLALAGLPTGSREALRWTEVSRKRDRIAALAVVGVWQLVDEDTNSGFFAAPSTVATVC